MPVSIVLNLQAAHPGVYRHATGLGVHGWWFQRWQVFDPSTAQALHHPARFSPFTLSPLMGLPQPRGGVLQVAEGAQAWLRLTVLSTDLEARLPDWLAAVPPVLPVDGIVWQVTSLAQTASQHPWAGSASYAGLRQLLDERTPPSHWELEFTTPTAFNGKKTQFPFPVPDMLIRSWLERWNVFAPFELPEDLIRAAREDLGVSSYSLRTQKVSEGVRQAVGCTGALSVRALEMPPALQVALNLLFVYAFYCGSGYHTTQGMGQTRLLKAR